MKKFLSTSVLLVLSLVGITTIAAQENEAVSQDCAVKGIISDVRIETSAKVVYTQIANAATPTVRVDGVASALEKIEVVQKGSKLVVKAKKSRTTFDTNENVTVYVSGHGLNSINILGAGVFESQKLDLNKLKIDIVGSGSASIDALNGKSLDVSIAGSGDFVSKNILMQDTKIEISGSGEAYLKGAAIKAIYTVNGSGSIGAEDFAVQSVVANVAGSGTVNCYACRLESHRSGSGSVFNHHK